MARKKAAETKISIRNVRDISGEFIVAGRDVYKGFTAEQVSFLIQQISTTFQPKKFDGQCPYKGLDVFEEADADLFFGRERLVQDLTRRVQESRIVFVTGPSGSGKSSLVRAGLLPALKNNAIKGSDSKHWLYATFNPGREPFEALKNVFSRLKSPTLGDYFKQNIANPDVLNECAEAALSERKDQKLVLFIDQFEEVFTQIGDEEIRESFLNLFTHAATRESGRIISLFAMRSDFVSNCADYPRLNSWLNQQFMQVGPMDAGELVSAIAQPVLRVGLRIDPDLIKQIINDMQGEPGTLPLMQFALKDLFESQQKQSGLIALTLNDYLQHGGIHESLERHADKTFAELTVEEQGLARSIFSGLIEIEHGKQNARRIALLEELIPADTKAGDVEAVVQKLTDARLTTTDEKNERRTVTLAHEKLIDAWPWLNQLINENREAIILQNEIAKDAGEWEVQEHDASYLYTGVRLANAREQLSAKKLRLSELAQTFVKAGFELEETRRQQEDARRQKELQDARQLAETTQAHLQAEQRGRRRLQMLVTVLALLTVGMFAALIRPLILRAMAQGDMAKIEAGPVVIGSDDPYASEEEKPQWTAHLDAFEIDRYEVTNYQYGLCVSAGVCQEPNDTTQFSEDQYANYPVAGVTAYQADTFCRWLGKRLPTELEWERAARGTDGRLWPWGKDAPSPQRANLAFDDDLQGALLPVTSLPAGASVPPESVFNLVGNVWEWTASYRQQYVDYDPEYYWDSSEGPPKDGLIQKGGSWNDNTLTRVTRRDSVLANEALRQVGIRCALSQ